MESLAPDFVGQVKGRKNRYGEFAVEELVVDTKDHTYSAADFFVNTVAAELEPDEGSYG